MARSVITRILLVVALSLASAVSSLAGVVGSPHDVLAQRYVISGREEKKKQNVCAYCHVPHKAKGARLWAVPPPALKGWGKVGPLCYSCHDGVAIISPNVDASKTAFNPKSHGLNLSEIPDGDDASRSGFPYAAGSEDGNIECSTCHNPHDDTNRPFLRAPINEICLKCHEHRENSGFGAGNEEGTHPVHNEPADEHGDASPIDVQEPFKVAYPRDYPAEDGKFTEGVHWTSGGHLSEGDKGKMECVTCHSVHGVEGKGPNTDRLLAADPVGKNSNEFCEGCHRGMRGDGGASPPFPNPGGTKTARSYHPADDDVGNGPGRKVEITQPQDWKFGEGGEVLCTTCHKPHRSMPNSPILRPIDGLSDTFCESCHNKPFAHHPSGAQTGEFVGSGPGGVRTSKPHQDTRRVEIPVDFPSGITYGKPVPGRLYCSTCHKAHNALCSPILVVECGDKGFDCGLCVRCHQRNNPTWQTDDNFKATHFTGDPTLFTIDKYDVDGNLIGTQNGYNDQYPPLNENPWPESGIKSVYAGASGKAVTCCSCHSFAVGNITAGDADDSPYTGSVQVAPDSDVKNLTTGLLARAGRFKEWLASDVYDYQVGGDRGSMKKVDKYLCTGCHGLTPNSHPTSGGGEGLTHPLMDADGSAFNPATTATLTFNRHVNCESCHSPHESDSRGGYFVLKTVKLQEAAAAKMPSARPDPYVIRTRSDIEFAPMCQKCHRGY